MEGEIIYRFTSIYKVIFLAIAQIYVVNAKMSVTTAILAEFAAIWNAGAYQKSHVPLNRRMYCRVVLPFITFAHIKKNGLINPGGCGRGHKYQSSSGFHAKNRGFLYSTLYIPHTYEIWK